MKNRFYFKFIFLLGLIIGVNPYMTAQCSFTGLNSNYCVNSATSALNTTVTGGSFTGPGVIGSTFNPGIAGPGTHTINYSICSSTYAITGGTGTTWYAPIPMPTVTTGPETPTSVALGDDQVSGALNIGFTFNFFCTAYTQFYISSNGFITFSAAQPNGCCSGQSLPDASTPNNLIALAWEDFNPGSGGNITFATVGTAPNRKLLVNFNAVPHFGSGGGPLSSQLQLFESTNVIEIHTSSMLTDGGNHTMGIENSGGTAAFVVAGRNASTTWSAANEMYRFTPGVSCISSQTTIVSPSTITVVGNNSICVGSTSSLTATGNTTYTWSTSSNASSILVSPTSNTTYSVSGTNSYGCVANSAITVTVDQTPTVTAISSNGTSGACPGVSVSLSGSGATSYTWTGGISNGVAFTPTTTTVYTVSGSNACGISSAAISVSVHPIPTVGGVASSASVCSGSSVSLTGTGNAISYVWTGGAGGVTNGIAFFPGTTATYTVVGANALTCTNSAVVPVAVVTTPSIPPTASPALICLGSSSTLTAIGATSYTWLPGNSNAASIIVSPTSAINTYTVIKSNANCVDTKTMNVIVNQLPVVFAIATPTLVCAGKPTNLAVGGGQTYTWTAPGPPSYTFTGASPVVSPLVNTIYTVAAHDGTCVNTTTVAVATDPNPTITIAASATAICVGQSVNLSASGGVNYTWTSTSGTVFTSTYSDTPTGPTLYNVTADNSFGCTATLNQIVLVNPNPTITIAVTKTLVCTTAPSTITASGANTYVWDAFAGGATTPGTVVNPINTTIYSVLGTYTATGCQTTKTVQVKVFTPTITVTTPTSTCFGGNITLVASGANPNSYNWNIGSGFTNPFQTIAVTPTVFTIYTVSAVSGSNGVNCASTQTTSINIFYNPTITAVPQKTFFCRGESLNIYGNGGVSYSWSNSQTGGTITVSPNTNTTYTVTGTDANGCVSTGTLLVKVSGCVGINELNGVNPSVTIYPNPNNGEFRISSDVSIKLNLVNELGQLIQVIDLTPANGFKADVSSLAKGIYFIVGTKNGLQVNSKIIVSE